jgi:integrase
MVQNQALPNRVNRKVRESTVIRLPNSQLRAREYLTPDEMERLIAAAKDTRYGLRDSTMLITIYRHGLRAQECCDLEWSAVDWKSSELHIRRVKGGKSTVHPIRGDELRMLRKLHRETNGGRFMFMTERGGPLTADNLNKLVKRLGAGIFNFPIHCHMIRHACGFKLANDGHDTRALQDYLGHRSISSTVRYTELTATKFKDFWR